MDTATRVRSVSLVLADTEPVLSRRDRLRAAIARLGGYCDWHVDSAGWVVTLHVPEERTFVGPTLEAALAADPSARLWVYGRAGKPCRRCGTPISRRKHGANARSTYWCERCQPRAGR